jgi:replicative DNA helicase
MNGSKAKIRTITQVKVEDAYEAECRLLGAMLSDAYDTDAVAAVTEYLDSPDYFYHSVNQRIFRAILALWNEGRPTDIASVFAWLRENESMDGINSRVLLMNFIDGRSMPFQIKEHARIVLHAALRRKLEIFGYSIIQGSKEYGHGVDEIMAAAEQGLINIENAYRGDSIIPLSAVLPEVQSDFEKKHNGEVTGLLTGYSDLDRLTDGFHPGELITLAARPSVGKSAGALNIAENLIRDNKSVGLISLEMRNIENAKRLVLSRARTGVTKGDQKISEENWDRIDRTIENLTGLPLYMNDQADISITRLKAIATKMRLNYKMRLLIVDYLQLVSCGRNLSSKNEEVSIVSRALKGLARKLGIPVLALSQLSRAIESRGANAKPKLSDLRDSGSIEQDSDIVIFIHPIDSKEDGGSEINADWIIAKNRNGERGSVRMHFIKDRVRWELGMKGKI